MPLTPLDAITIVPHVVSTLRRIAKSLAKKSAGGKRITKEEGAAIVAELRELGEVVLRAVAD